MKIISAIFLSSLIFIGCTGCTSCQFAPSRSDYDTELAFMLSDCNFRNQQNPAACVKLAERYNDRDQNKEQREILDFCKNKDNYPEGWDNEKCRMFLKQR